MRHQKQFRMIVRWGFLDYIAEFSRYSDVGTEQIVSKKEIDIRKNFNPL